jgi:hypothetical protein
MSVVKNGRQIMQSCQPTVQHLCLFHLSKQSDTDPSCCGEESKVQEGKSKSTEVKKELAEKVLMPFIPAIWEIEIGRIMVQGQPRQEVCKMHLSSQATREAKIRWISVPGQPRQKHL